MSERKLASIMTVKEVANIEGKDKIGYVSFLETGWEVIGSKSLKPGDKVLYLEYDSVIPEKTLDKLDLLTVTNLRKRCWSIKHNGCLIRAMKMSGKISYGILFEYRELFQLFEQSEWDKLVPGTDLTEKLGILKRDDESGAVSVQEKANFFQKWYNIIMWKVFRKKKKKVLGSWPIFLQKTDESRVHALPPETLEQFKGKNVYVSEKLDGQSISCAIYKKNFYVCSRNMALYMKPVKKAIKELIPQNASKQVDRYLASICKYDLASRMYLLWRPETRWKSLKTLYPDAVVQPKKPFKWNDFAIQAEQVGPGIQRNPCQLDSVELFVFNIYDIIEKRYYNDRLLTKTVEWLNVQGKPSATDLKTVPILQKDIKFTWETIKELEELAKGPTFNGKNKNREGIVIRANEFGVESINCYYIEEPPRGCSGMASFKVINPNYLLNNKEDE